VIIIDYSLQFYLASAYRHLGAPNDQPVNDLLQLKIFRSFSGSKKERKILCQKLPKCNCSNCSTTTTTTTTATATAAASDRFFLDQ